MYKNKCAQCGGEFLSHREFLSHPYPERPGAVCPGCANSAKCRLCPEPVHDKSPLCKAHWDEWHENPLPFMEWLEEKRKKTPSPIHMQDLENAAQALYDVRDGLPASDKPLWALFDKLGGAMSRYSASGRRDLFVDEISRIQLLRF